MLAAGFLPLLHLLSIAAVVFLPAGIPSMRSAASGVAVLYLVPPLAARVCRAGGPLRAGVAVLGSRDFLAWWLEAQWQIIFNRLPALEELLRLVPGLYSLWLRLWGARVGRLTFWAPGVSISDRALLDVGDHVVFGAGVRMHAHVMKPDASGVMGLLVAPITIGAESLVGAFSLLLPGSSVAAGEVMPALKTLGPFTEWRGGQRHAAERKQDRA